MLFFHLCPVTENVLKFHTPKFLTKWQYVCHEVCEFTATIWIK